MKLCLVTVAFSMLMLESFAGTNPQPKALVAPNPKLAPQNTVMVKPHIKKKLKWVLAHEPIDLFLPAAKSFSDEVAKKSNGELTVEVMSLNDYSKKYKGGKAFTASDVSSLVRSGDVDLSQTYSSTLAMGYSSLHALDLPFIFRDHDHATRVLDGQIGKVLLDGIGLIDLKGLAFTYSGGYRILPGRKALNKLEDFKNLNVSTSMSPVAHDTLLALGASPMTGIATREFSGIFVEKSLDLAELTYARYFAIQKLYSANDIRFVNETNHSLFLTVIVMNNRLWNEMPDEQRAIIQNAARSAAALERKNSIESNASSMNKLEKAGFKIVKMKTEEVNKMKAALKPVYEKYSRLLGKELIQSIMAQ